MLYKHYTSIINRKLQTTTLYFSSAFTNHSSIATNHSSIMQPNLYRPLPANAVTCLRALSLRSQMLVNSYFT